MRALYLTLLVAGGACSYAPARSAIESDAGNTEDPADAPQIPATDAPPADAPQPIDAPPADPVSMELPITVDTYVDVLSPNTTRGSSATMLVDGDDTATILLRVDLSEIPTTATVTAAELVITVATDTGSGGNVFELLESWSEANATHNVRDTGMPWSAPGAAPPARNTVVIGGPVAGSPSNSQQVVPIALDVVQKWVANPAVNFGMAIATTANNGTFYRSSDDGTAGRRPAFRITYQP